MRQRHQVPVILERAYEQAFEAHVIPLQRGRQWPDRPYLIIVYGQAMRPGCILFFFKHRFFGNPGFGQIRHPSSQPFLVPVTVLSLGPTLARSYFP